jgi:hypothetical protein
MKTKKIIFVAFLLTLSVNFSSCETESKATDCWDYPIKPGMPEWAKLSSGEAMHAACQIPENILYGLSTECLTEVCGSYPLLFDLIAFNCWSQGFDAHFDRFNGIRELYDRKNALTELLKNYNNNMQTLSCTENRSIGELYFLTSGEILLYGYSRKVESTRETYIEILRSLVAGYEKKLKNENYIIFIKFNYFARLQAILKLYPEYEDELRGGMCGFLENMKDRINELSYQLIL